MKRAVHGRDAGQRAVPCWVCADPKCEVHHTPLRDPLSKKWIAPKRCLGCGKTEFIFFQSSGEAKHWADLRQRERVGLISKLRRQVPFGLHTVSPEGLAVKVADVVLDFVYEHDGEVRHVDWKPVGKADPLAALKFKWLKAEYGIEVHIESADDPWRRS